MDVFSCYGPYSEGPPGLSTFLRNTHLGALSSQQRLRHGGSNRDKQEMCSHAEERADHRGSNTPTILESLPYPEDQGGLQEHLGIYVPLKFPLNGIQP